MTYMYITLGQTAPRGQHFDVNRKALSLYPFAVSFKEISLKSDFIQYFHSLIQLIAILHSNVSVQPNWFCMAAGPKVPPFFNFP